ncbi:PIF1 [Candida oxycetoniae]|uniref:ATP-dependent DNA helicase PIF1 n=1 Tax=Candida oxycetoniae TaxID=497107 RepID=A0AAI9SW46_9ASCO|nr:PIF1 [Candida oxycetoniae]KAI3404178.2 PIF1 [Candida oxycetoniae]
MYSRKVIAVIRRYTSRNLISSNIFIRRHANQALSITSFTNPGKEYIRQFQKLMLGTRALSHANLSALEGIDIDDSFGEESASQNSAGGDAQLCENESSTNGFADGHRVGRQDRESKGGFGNTEEMLAESFEFSDNTPSSRLKLQSNTNSNTKENGDKEGNDALVEPTEAYVDDLFEFSDSELSSPRNFSKNRDRVTANSQQKEEEHSQTLESSSKLKVISQSESSGSRAYDPSFEFSEEDNEVLAAVGNTCKHSSPSPQKENHEDSSFDPKVSPTELRKASFSLHTQTPIIKAPQRSTTMKHIITTSPSKSESPSKKHNPALQIKLSESPTRKRLNSCLESPPSVPIRNILKDFKAPCQAARYYSTGLQSEQPKKTPVNYTLQLATQKPSIDNVSEKAPVETSTLSKKVQPIILSREQESVLQRVLSGVSLFYTGSAGTGKSVLLRSIIKALKHIYPHGVAVTASTGLAACNIGGITLHSFSGIGLGNSNVESLVRKIRKNKKASRRWLETKVLIIDEISMVDGALLDKLNEIAKIFRKNDAPFGGIQLVACGDFYQLPPVVKKVNAEGELNEDVEAFFSFECLAWKETIQETIILKEVFRQKGDQTFIDMLNEMRDGKISVRTIQEFKKLSRPLKCPPGIVPAELFATRYEVERANNIRLRALPGEEIYYRAHDTGSLDEKQRIGLLSNFLAPQELHLKKDAQVMCIKNFDETLVNGSLGTIVDFMDKDTYMKAFSSEEQANENGILKDFVYSESDMPQGPTTTGSLTQKNQTEEDRRKTTRRMDLNDNLLDDFKNKKCPLVRFLSPDGVNTRTVLVEPEEWTVEDEDGKVLVSRIQFPIMLAWSLSIHKSQGQTLTKVKVDLKKVFETGQSYVALSRATSREGLQVLNFNVMKVRSHPKVVKFYNSLAILSSEVNSRGHGQQKLNFRVSSYE